MALRSLDGKLLTAAPHTLLPRGGPAPELDHQPLHVDDDRVVAVLRDRFCSGLQSAPLNGAHAADVLRSSAGHRAGSTSAPGNPILATAIAVNLGRRREQQFHSGQL